MYRAPTVFKNYLLNYHSKDGFSSYYEYDLPKTQSNYIRELENPQSEYHRWLRSGAQTPFDEAKLFEMSRIGTVADNTMPYTPIELISSAVDIPVTKIGPRTKGKSAKKRVVVTHKVLTNPDEIEDLDEKDIVSRTDDNLPIIHLEEEVSDNESVIYDEDELKISGILSIRPVTKKKSRKVRRIPKKSADEIMADDIYLGKFTDAQLRVKIFEQMKKLQWRDLDEYKVSSSYMDNFDKWTMRALLTTMINMCHTELRPALDTNGALYAALLSGDEDFQYNVMFHIIAKGKIFYNACISEPSFAQYLLDSYQPLYTYMKTYYGETNIQSIISTITLQKNKLKSGLSNTLSDSDDSGDSADSDDSIISDSDSDSDDIY